MKSILLPMFFVFFSFLAQSQVNFDSYNNITDPAFEGFVALFAERNLPLSTDALLAEQNLQNPSVAPIPNGIIDQFLKRDGEHIITKLYDLELEGGQPDHPMMGEFYPLYKLPTNGNYVMLVLSQIDPYESFNRVHVMTFDLSGQFIRVVHSLYSANSIDLNNWISTDLQVHYNYVLYEVSGQDTKPPRDQQFTGLEADLVYLIQSDGTSQEVSFTKTPGDFVWDDIEKRYKRVN